MATLGKIRCDLCAFIGDLESENGKASMSTPIGWTIVFPTVRIAHRGLTKKKMSLADNIHLSTVKKQIAKKVHSMHICPSCLMDKTKWEGNQPLMLIASND